MLCTYLKNKFKKKKEEENSQTQFKVMLEIQI